MKGIITDRYVIRYVEVYCMYRFLSMLMSVMFLSKLDSESDVAFLNSWIPRWDDYFPTKTTIEEL